MIWNEMASTPGDFWQTPMQYGGQAQYGGMPSSSFYGGGGGWIKGPMQAPAQTAVQPQAQLPQSLGPTQPGALAKLMNSQYQGPSLRSIWEGYQGPQAGGMYRMGG